MPKIGVGQSNGTNPTNRIDCVKLLKMSATIDTIKVDVMQSHLMKSGNLFDCFVCEKVFCTEQILEEHYQKDHELQENPASSLYRHHKMRLCKTIKVK